MSSINVGNKMGQGLYATADSSGVLAINSIFNPALTIGTDQNVTFNSSGAMTIPVGTTAQRPATPSVGMVRYNTSLNALESYLNNSWVTIA